MTINYTGKSCIHECDVNHHIFYLWKTITKFVVYNVETKRLSTVCIQLLILKLLYQRNDELQALTSQED